jgi:ketosteroid isomerase-like protein
VVRGLIRGLAISTEWSEFRDLGDRVLAFGHLRARGHESGVEVDSPMGWVITVRRGKLIKAEGFLSRADALEAAGLRE